MVDWGLVAVVIAVLAYPLQVLAIPPFIRFFGRAGGWLYRYIWPAAGQCTALEWTDFSTRPWHGTKSLPQAQCCELNSDDLHQASQLLFSGAWEPALSLLFPEPWRKAVVQDKVSKPHQLSAITQYIRTDPAVVLLYVYFSALCSPYRDGSRSEFNHFVQLTEKNGVLVAQMRSTNDANDNLHSRGCKYACTKLCSVTQTLMLLENREDFPDSLVLREAEGPDEPEVRINMHSTDNKASWRRGGWVVAVGMSSAQSSPLLRPILRNDLVKSSFCYARDDHIMLPKHVNDALQRVIYTLDNLNEVFHNEHLENALAMTEQFRVELLQYLVTHSVLGMVLKKSPLFRNKPYKSRGSGWGAIDSQSIDTYEFVINLFNRYQVLTSDEKEKLRPILEEVCRTALIGMIRVFIFYEYGYEYGTISADDNEILPCIREPAVLKKYKHVYLEDR